MGIIKESASKKGGESLETCGWPGWQLHPMYENCEGDQQQKGNWWIYQVARVYACRLAQSRISYEMGTIDFSPSHAFYTRKTNQSHFKSSNIPGGTQEKNGFPLESVTVNIGASVFLLVNWNKWMRMKWMGYVKSFSPHFYFSPFSPIKSCSHLLPIFISNGLSLLAE